MNKEDLAGKLVRLVPFEPDRHAALLAAWNRDSEYGRLLDGSPAKLFTEKQVKEWNEKEDHPFFFMIQTLAEDKIIGLVELDGVNWTWRESFVGIGLGEREYWGQGFGTDAMTVILRYAFRQLDLRRVSLTVFEYNPRAVRSYEKAGFQHEGRLRQALSRDGRRWDVLFMGILRDEWEKELRPGTDRITEQLEK
jgi:RimJ/RimL family protein N-acetyltransferase